MNPTQISIFSCGECGELHDFEKNALDCCAPEVTEVKAWRCAECGYVSFEEDTARYCCLDEGIVLRATQEQLEANGQERIPL